MNDHSQSEIARTMARFIENMNALGDDDLRKKASNLIMRLEACYTVCVDRLDDAAGDDRTGIYAESALEMKSLLRDIQSVHCKASIVEGKVTGQPMTRGGER